jgi:WD40-like Beta Propeller Repeat
MKRALLALSLLGALALAAPAGAAWQNGATIVSASYERLEQADGPSQSVDISDDGRYAVFQTRAQNLFASDDPDPPHLDRVGGIFRHGLAPGKLELVADGDLYDSSLNLVRKGAQAPAVSADGRYVAFSTQQALDRGDTNDAVDVYVRDMDLDPGAPGAFTLASALDNGDVAPAYDGAAGTRSSPRTAISDDGRRVAMFTTAASNLPSGGAGTPTPAGQVIVRDLDSRRTTLVSQTTSGAPAGGAPPSSEVAISGDASVVAWSGTARADQTRLVGGEAPGPALLWRRIADGPSAPTRRVTGAGDPDDPGCPPGGAMTSASAPVAGPCDGPLVNDPNAGYGPFALTGDGTRVAFTADAAPRAAIGAESPGRMDVFLADMHPGLSRKAGTQELTREGQDKNDRATSTDIVGIGMSENGGEIALTTQRTRFLLSPPTLIGSAGATVDNQEVYVIDVGAGTIEVAVHGVGGARASGNDTPTQPTLSADGSRIGFSSNATNLIVGDGNSAPDAFVVDRTVETGRALEQRTTVAPQPTLVIPDWVMRATATTHSDGKIAVVAVVPGAGRVQATATTKARPRKARRAARRVTRKTGSADGPGAITVVLKVPRRDRALARRRHGLTVAVSVRYQPTAGAGISDAPLSSSLKSRFVLKKKRTSGARA